MFLGGVLGICGVIALAIVLRTQPQWVVQPEQIAINIHRQTPVQLWAYWRELRAGLGSGEDPIRQRYEKEWADYYRHRTMAIIPLAVGLAMVLAGLALVAASGKRRQRRSINRA
jgi:hypothetical protein